MYLNGVALAGRFVSDTLGPIRMPAAAPASRAAMVPNPAAYVAAAALPAEIRFRLASHFIETDGNFLSFAVLM